MKKVFFTLLTFLTILLLILLAIPYLYKNEILQAVKHDLNKNFTAQVDFDDVNISLFKTFPDLYFELENFRITGTGEKKDIPLASIQNLGLTVDLIKLFKGAKQIKEVHINQGDFVVYVTADGKANYDIIKPSGEAETTDQPSELELEIEKFTANHINLLYDDQSLDMQMKIINLNHEGNIQIAGDQYLLKGHSQADTLRFVFDNIPYLNNVQAIVNHEITIKNDFSTYELNDIKANINDLPVRLTGKIEMPGDDININLQFASEKNRLPLFISLIPKAYMPDLPEMDIQGNARLKGNISGVYNENNYPGYHIEFIVENGKIKGKDLPESVHDINVNTLVNFEGGNDLDKTAIDMPRIQFSVADNTAKGFLHVRNPMTDPFVHTAFKTTLDLSKIKQALPLSNIQKLAGLLDADFEVKGRVSAMEKQQTGQIDAHGYFNLKDFMFVSDSLPYPVQIPTAESRITPNSIEVNNTKIIAGKSDFSVRGNITNYLAFATGKDSTLKARLHSQSNLIDFNELSGGMSQADDDQENTAVSAPGIPKNLDIQIDAQAKELIYEDMHIKDLESKITVKDQKARLETLVMKALGGELLLTGLYDTSGENPYSQLKTQLKKVQLDQSAQSLTYLKTYAPLLKEIKGMLNMEFALGTQLDSLMNPVLSTTDAQGVFSTGKLQPEHVKIFKTVAGLLKIKELENPIIDKIKASFRINKGNLTIKPFQFKVNQIKSDLGGSVRLDKKLDLNWNMEIPVEMFGNQAQAWLNHFQSQLQGLGIPLEQIKTVYVTLKISGSVDKPVIKPVFRKGKGMQGAVETVKETVTQLATEKIEETKAQAETKAEELIKQAEQKGDELIRQAEAAAQKIRAEADKQARKLIDKASNPIEKFAAQKAAEKIRKEADKKAQALIEKAKQEKQKLIEQAKQKAEKISGEN